MGTADEAVGRGQDLTDAAARASQRQAHADAPDLTAPGLGVTDEMNPGEGDLASGVGEDQPSDEVGAGHSAGDVDLEDPDSEVQTSTERTIGRAASEAGRHVAAAAQAGWDDPERAANPVGGYDLTAPVDDLDPERPAAYVDPESPAAYVDPYVDPADPGGRDQPRDMPND